jgi:hypothetical protein
MRILLTIAIFAGAMLALDSPADAARKHKRSYKPPYAYQANAERVCQERARHEDPTGEFAGFPCWAREALARGRNINPR